MKKQLLQESEIRKMMKFANIGALTNGFVDRLTEAEEMIDEEDKTDGIEEGMYEAEEPMADELPVDELPVDEPAEDDFPAEEPGVEGALELSEEEAQVLVDLGERLAGELGGDMDDEGLDDEGLDDEDVGDIDVGDIGDEIGGDEDLVNEVARRVGRRLAARRG